MKTGSERTLASFCRGKLELKMHLEQLQIKNKFNLHAALTASVFVDINWVYVFLLYTVGLLQSVWQHIFTLWVVSNTIWHAKTANTQTGYPVYHSYAGNDEQNKKKNWQRCNICWKWSCLYEATLQTRLSEVGTLLAACPITKMFTVFIPLIIV